jgi:hypothetical protein
MAENRVPNARAALELSRARLSLASGIDSTFSGAQNGNQQRAREISEEREWAVAQVSLLSGFSKRR